VNAPPAFDRRARPRVEWTFDRVSGKVDLVASGDGFEGRIEAASIAYAAYWTNLFLSSKPGSAFEPTPAPFAPELSPEVEALIERDADADMGLKAGEAG
jgi:hypothetical protein